MHRKTIEAYDQIATGYSVENNTANFWEKEINFFLSRLRGKKIIDIGCGTGRDADVFVSKGLDYLGIDASEGMLQVAVAKVPAGKFIQAEFGKLNYASESFDGFWASASLLHIPKKDLSTVLTEIKRVIKSDGIGFISIREEGDKDTGVVIEKKFGHDIQRLFTNYSESEFENILLQQGFEIVKTGRRSEGGHTWLVFFVEKVNLVAK